MNRESDNVFSLCYLVLRVRPAWEHFGKKGSRGRRRKIPGLEQIFLFEWGKSLLTLLCSFLQETILFLVFVVEQGLVVENNCLTVRKEIRCPAISLI